MIKAIQFSGMLFLFCSPVMAGTIVEIQNNNELTTLITDGQKARMSMSGSEYVIVDYRNQSAKIINPELKQVKSLSVDDLVAGNNTVTVEISINNLGNAQEIAGYQTQKFSYQANGRSCGVIYGSKSAYQANGIKELLAALKTFMDKQRAALGGFASLVDACTLAGMQLMDHISTIGLPLRIEKNGHAELEIKSIKADASLAEDTFVIPASYKILGGKQQMKAASTGRDRSQQQRQQAQKSQSRQSTPQAVPTDRARPQPQSQQVQARQLRQLSPQAMKAASTDRARPHPQMQQAHMRQPRQYPPQGKMTESAEMAMLQQQQAQQAQIRQYRRPPQQAWQQQMRPAATEMRRAYQRQGY